MRIHPAAKILPEMAPEEFTNLKADIQLHGLLCPVELLKGAIIDGRHRHRACLELGIQPDFVEVDLNGQSPAEYVWSTNGVRRHLSASQRAAIAVDLLPGLEKAAKERQRLSKGRGQKGPKKVPDLSRADARDQAAAIVGTNPHYVSDAKRLKEQAPDVFDRIKTGELTVSQAKAEQRKSQKRKDLSAASKKAKSTRTALDCRIVLGDCLTELPKLHGVNLIFADPPYNIGVDYGGGKKADKLPDGEYLAWCAEWIRLCANALAENGTFWLLVPDEYAEYFAVMLNDCKLHRRAWVKWYETFGINCQNNFNRTSRHLFYYTASRKSFTFNADAVNRPSDRQTKYNDSRASEGGKIWDDVWQIPRLQGTSSERLPDFPTQLPLALLEPIIQATSMPGDLVVDPFCGSGAAGVVAKQRHRRFVGIEKEKRFWEMANARLVTSVASTAGKRT